MQGISFNKQSYVINGKPTFLYSGEFHYFRIPRQDWRRRMDLFLEAGGNCIATYIPWLIHEPQEGKFAFGTEGYLDLEGFLKTAQEAGLPVLARPGPYQYSELVYGGVPRWLYDCYPQLHALRLNGQPIRKGSVSYVHPLFLEKVGKWFDIVCPILAGYSISRGGPVVLTQFDNELMGFHLWYGSMDFNPESMGFGLTNGRFPTWLRGRYQTIETLNDAYDTLYSRFEDVLPAVCETPARASEFRSKKDYFEFYLQTVADYGKILSEMMRQRGIDTPFVHNSANPEMNAYFVETVESSGSDFLLGSDHYYNLDQTWNQNNPTPQFAMNCFYSNEMLRLLGFPPTIFELPCGSASDWPPITPEDIRACVLLNIALGMKGSNYYIFTGGPNPPGAGLTTDLYDYGAPIGANNEVRPLFSVVKEIGHLLQSESWLALAEQVFDVRVALDFDQARSKLYEGPVKGIEISGDNAWSFTRKGLLTTAFCASLSPAFVDLRTDEAFEDTSTPLIVVCSSSMARAKQERIIRFLKNGGKALILPVLPKFDENLKPCSLLRQYLENPQIIPSDGSQVRLNLDTVTNVFNNGAVFFSETMPLAAKSLMVDEMSGKSVSWSFSPSEGGKVIFLGFKWLHAKREHEQMLLRLLQEIGLRQRVFCSNPNVWTVLRQHGPKQMLFAMNLSTSSMETDIHYFKDDGEKVEHAAIQMNPITVKMLPS